MRPTTLDGPSLAAILRDMANRVERYDSYEGNITYEPTDSPNRTYSVLGVYRVGNSQGGQGGMRIVGEAEG